MWNVVSSPPRAGQRSDGRSAGGDHEIGNLFACWVSGFCDSSLFYVERMSTARQPSPERESTVPQPLCRCKASCLLRSQNAPTSLTPPGHTESAIASRGPLPKPQPELSVRAGVPPREPGYRLRTGRGSPSPCTTSTKVLPTGGAGHRVGIQNLPAGRPTTGTADRRRSVC